ncbi:MAG: BamA/TamA family outer membrane protein [Longimicrobiales bacterium]
MPRVLLVGTLAGAAATGVQAQASPPFAELPDSVAERVIAFYNAAGTNRFSGQTLIAAGSELAGPLAVIGGPVTVAGRVQGDVVVINGDLRLTPDAMISGSVTVVGGGVDAQEGASVGGRTAHYREPLRFRHLGEELVHAPEPAAELSAGREFGFGRTDIVVAMRGAYNRVEGMPIAVGPRIGLGRSNPTTLEGLVIYRSSSGLRIDPDELGYAVRAEQYLGGGRTARVGLRLFSEITPIESWGLSDRENSLATFLLHSDYRDSYRREGWAAYVRFARPGWAHDLTIEYRDERHGRVAPASPWSLIDNEQAWRPQPLIAEGTIRTLSARLGYDTRNDHVDPSNGWHIVAELEQGLGGRLSPAASIDVTEPEETPSGTAFSRERFTAARFDIRRYVRVGPGSKVALRLLAAGSVDGTALPPQHQQALGGEGSLPGYRLFEFDCGARSLTVDVDGEQFYPVFGCDRLAVAQVEYETDLPFVRRIGPVAGLDLDRLLRLVVFADAGRAWTEAGARSGRLTGSSRVKADAGIGIRFGRAGAYWAVPVTGGGHTVNFFVRIGRRF